MSDLKHNIDIEKRLIKLFGYNLIEPDSSNRFIIIDENHNQVGFVQYKKLHNGNTKRGFNKVLGYHTFIDSQNIKYEFIREINDKYGNIIDNDDYNYSFDIKRSNNDKDHVEVNIGDYPSLTVWSKEYGFIYFKVDFQGLFLNFKSKTDNFNIEEVLIYNNELHEKKEYIYQLSYCKKEYDLSNNKAITTREISGSQNYNDNKLKICIKTWTRKKLKTNKEYIVDGTIEEMATKHQMGIDCFNRFRLLINQIIPFNEDIISLIINNDKVKENNLPSFIKKIYTKK